MWNPFQKKTIQTKSFDDIDNAAFNKFLQAVFQFNTHAGIANTIDDNPTAYLTKGYAGNDDVFSIINRIIRMSQQARLALYKTENNRWVEVTNHELNKFLRNVNPTQKTSDFIQGHLIYKLAIGNSYWYKPALTAGANKGKTKEIYLLPANNVEIIGSSSWMSPIGGYRLTHNSPVVFEPESIYHSKFFNPLFGQYGSLYGQSPLRAAASIVSKQNEAALTELRQFENQSPPYLIFRDSTEIAAQLTDAQRAEMREMFKKHAAGKSRGSGLIAPEKLGMLRLGVSPVDLGILDSSIDGRRRLCNIYGFPAQLMNDAAATTDNNVQEVRKAAWSDCIIPNLTELAADLTAFLIDPVQEYQGLFFGWDYSEVQELQADMVKKVEWMTKAWCSPNAILEATGQKPVNNPLMDEPWVPMGVIPLSQATEDLTAQQSLKNFDYK